MISQSLPSSDDGNTIEESLFAAIARDLETQGYSVRPAALPEAISSALVACREDLEPGEYSFAGIGRGADHAKNAFVRTDEICWIGNELDGGRAWNDWAARLRAYLNRRLFLGLFSFESHFSHYAPGAYYRKHRDAFRGEANRVLSVVTYLNAGWTRSDGGELVIYRNRQDREGLRIMPLCGTIVVFLSEQFVHEVLPARRDRYSVAGWFRVNGSTQAWADPPR